MPIVKLKIVRRRGAWKRHTRIEGNRASGRHAVHHWLREIDHDWNHSLLRDRWINLAGQRVLGHLHHRIIAGQQLGTEAIITSGQLPHVDRKVHHGIGQRR